MSQYIEASFGHNTIALLDRCSMCGKPYQEQHFHTLCTDVGTYHVFTVWCDECFGKLEKVSE